MNKRVGCDAEEGLTVEVHPSYDQVTAAQRTRC